MLPLLRSGGMAGCFVRASNDAHGAGRKEERLLYSTWAIYHLPLTSIQAPFMYSSVCILAPKHLPCWLWCSRHVQWDGCDSVLFGKSLFVSFVFWKRLWSDNWLKAVVTNLWKQFKIKEFFLRKALVLIEAKHLTKATSFNPSALDNPLLYRFQQGHHNTFIAYFWEMSSVRFTSYHHESTYSTSP